ncbi:MAG: hypothetical protein AAGK97_03190 [Bacteroidota bacterium]
MKFNLVFFLLNFICIMSTLNGQSYDRTDKFRSISVFTGLRSFSSEPGTVISSYVDDSPSMDQFFGTETIDDYIHRIGFGFSYHWGRMKGLSHQLGMELVLGLSESVHLAYGIGYTIPIETKENVLLIRPALHGLIGNTRINLGLMENNAAYIQIGALQYFDEFIRVKLNTDTFIFRPKLDVLVPMGEHLRIFGSLGYDIGTQTGAAPTLWFETLAGESDTEVELEVGKAEVNYNGSLIESIPFGTDGPRISIGISYYWEKLN